MDDERDDTYEILDLRPASGRRRKRVAESDLPANEPAHEGQPEPAPVLDLGDGAGAAEPPTNSPTWHRWAVLAIAFVAGVAAGGYGWYAGEEAGDAGRVELVALHMFGEVFDAVEQSRLLVDLHNAGARDVTVLQLRTPGWSDAPDVTAREIAIKAGESGRMVVSGAPRCESGVPESIEAEVRTDAGESTVVIPLPATNPARSSIAMVCGIKDNSSFEFPAFYFIEDGSRTTPQASPFHMLLEIERAAGVVEILDVTVTAPGFTAQATNLPLLVRQGVPRNVELLWTISDCAATRELGSVDIELALADGEPTATLLPPWAIAQLARLAAAECGP